MVKKGQGAAEYLILLAIVLIVSLIGVVLLGGITGGTSDTMDAEAQTYWSGVARPFRINEWAQINDTLYMEVGNIEMRRMVLTNISVGGHLHNISGGGWVFGPNAVKNMSIGVPWACDAQSYDYFDYDIVIYYDTTDISGRAQYGDKSIAGRCVFP